MCISKFFWLASLAISYIVKYAIPTEICFVNNNAFLSHYTSSEVLQLYLFVKHSYINSQFSEKGAGLGTVNSCLTLPLPPDGLYSVNINHFSSNIPGRGPPDSPQQCTVCDTTVKFKKTREKSDIAPRNLISLHSIIMVIEELQKMWANSLKLYDKNLFEFQR